MHTRQDHPVMHADATTRTDHTLDTRDDALRMLGMLLHLTVYRALGWRCPPCMRVGSTVTFGVDDTLATMETRLDALDARGDVPMSKRSDGMHLSVSRRTMTHFSHVSPSGACYSETTVFAANVSRIGHETSLRYRVEIDMDIDHPITRQAIDTWADEHLRLRTERARETPGS